MDANIIIRDIEKRKEVVEELREYGYSHRGVTLFEADENVVISIDNKDGELRLFAFWEECYNECTIFRTESITFTDITEFLKFAKQASEIK